MSSILFIVISLNMLAAIAYCQVQYGGSVKHPHIAYEISSLVLFLIVTLMIGVGLVRI